MASRLKITGVILIIVGIVAWGAAGYAYTRYQDGQDALNGFSEAQDVELATTTDGNLIDRGTEEGAKPSSSSSVRRGNGPSSTASLTPMTQWSTRPPSTCTRWPPSATTR